MTCQFSSCSWRGVRQCWPSWLSATPIGTLTGVQKLLSVATVLIGVTVDVQAWVKVMDTHAISRNKINALRHVLPDVPSDARIRDETAALDAEVATHLGLYWTHDSAAQ